MDYKVITLDINNRIILYCVVGVIGLGVGWLFYDSIFAGIIIFIALLSFEGEYKNFLIAKRNQELLLQFKDFLYSLSTAVSTGRNISQGIRESYMFWKGTYSEDDYIMLELRSFVEIMEKGQVDEISILEDFASRSGLEDIQDMAMMCRICKRTGANLSVALQECNSIIGDKIALERELKTLMIQKKFEGYIIAIAPILLMLLMKVFSPGYLDPLTSTNHGKLISTISLALIVAAWLMIERVNDIEI